MKRRNFLKNLFKGAAVATVAVATGNVAKAITKEEKEEFEITELFNQPYPGNTNLYCLKRGTWLEKEILNALGDKFIPDTKAFSFYSPVYNIYLPVKDTYTKSDFEAIINWCKFGSPFDKYCYYGMQDNPSLCRMYRDERKGCYKFDFYGARNLYKI